MKLQIEHNIETQYICEHCGTIHLRHRLILVGGTVTSDQYWPADKLRCCGQDMQLRVIHFDRVEEAPT